MWRGNPINTLCHQTRGLDWAVDTLFICIACMVHWRAPAPLPGQQGGPRDIPRYRPCSLWQHRSHSYLGKSASDYDSTFNCAFNFLHILVQWSMDELCAD